MKKSPATREGGGPPATRESAYWTRLRVLWLMVCAFPVILFVVAYVMRQNGFVMKEEVYEQPAARIVQYTVFWFGVVIFFFCDGIAHFLARKILLGRANSESIESESPGAVSRYGIFIILTMSLLNLIGLSGFVGFLISSNLTWLGLFVLLNLSLQFKYYPTAKRFAGLLRFLQSS